MSAHADAWQQHCHAFASSFLAQIENAVTGDPACLKWMGVEPGPYRLDDEALKAIRLASLLILKTIGTSRVIPTDQEAAAANLQLQRFMAKLMP